MAPPTDSSDETEIAVPTSIARSGGKVRLLVQVAVALSVLGLLSALANNDNMGWDVVARYFFSPLIFKGLLNTLWLTVVAVVGGVLLGIVLASMRLSGEPVLVGVSWAYTWFFRSSPLLVQLLFWFNIAAVFPSVTLGIPFAPEISKILILFGGEPVDFEFFSFSTQGIVNGWTAAVLGMILHEAAYAGEIVRGGVSSIDSGQTEAAQSLGLSRFRVFWRIIFPQAMKSIIPNLGNLVVMVLKATSILSVIAVPDLLYSAQIIYNANYLVIPLLIVATLWYLIVTSVLSMGQYYVERYYARGARHSLPPTPFQRLKASIQSVRTRRQLRTLSLAESTASVETEVER